jgi:hypothetical protein
MFQLKPRTINDLLIAVTDTATLIYTLVDTASTVAGSQAYYGNETDPGAGVANCVSIRAQDGDIRVIIDATPTAVKGFLIRSGTRQFFNGEISKMKLIRASGAATVACDIEFFKVERGEVMPANTDTITAVVDSEFPAASALADATANPTTTTTGANLMVFNGTTWDRARGGVITPSVTTTGLLNTLPEAIYNATPTTRTEGQAGVFQSTSLGDVKIAEGYVDKFVDNTNSVAWTVLTPLAVATNAITTDISAALEASSIAKATAGRFYSSQGRIDSTQATGTYFIMVLNSATLPADGAVTRLCDSLKINHTTGVDSNYTIDFTSIGGLWASAGIVTCISSTSYTKTIGGAYLSSTNLIA